MIKINVLVSNKNWKKHIKKPEIYLKKKTKKLNTNIFFKKRSVEFSILLSNNKEIKKLNLKYRKKDKSTDVLSFPFHKKETLKRLLEKKKLIYLGDIIINLDKILDASGIEKLERGLNKTWIHGLLHLLGSRHKLNADYLKMKKLENKFLNLIS